MSNSNKLNHFITSGIKKCWIMSRHQNINLPFTAKASQHINQDFSP